MRIHTFVLPEPFSIGTVNVYLIETDRLTLIDCGPKTSEAEERLMLYLSGLNYKVTDIRQILLTHCHPDHTGLSNALGSLSGARVFVHPAELESGIQVQSEGLSQSCAQLFKSAGLTPGELAQVEANHHKLYDGNCQQHLWLADGDFVDIGEGYSLEVIHTPGHTLGHCCFWEPQEGILFSGDQVLEKLLPLPSLEIDHQGQHMNMMVPYLQSIQKLLALQPKRVLPGHGSMIYDMETVIDDVAKHLQVRKRELLTQITGSITVMELVRRLYPGIKGLDTMPAVAKIWGILDLLQADGLVQWQMEDGVIHYTKSSK